MSPRKWPTAEERLWARVDKGDGTGCWIWTGNTSGGGVYGSILVNGRATGVHRFAYELLVGPIPPGLYIDHLCRNPRCVRPDHLEPVTNGANVLRGNGMTAVNARKSRCPEGHVYDRIDSMGRRYCSICERANRLARYKARGLNAGGRQPIDRSASPDQGDQSPRSTP